MWMQYWGFVRDPFDQHTSPFVPLPAHCEAVARLTEAVESGQRLTIFEERGGMGKSRVLGEFSRTIRSLDRRIVSLGGIIDGATLFTRAAEGLGRPVPAGTSRGGAWLRLGEGLKLCRSQKLQVVIIVDDCQDLCTTEDRKDLSRLVHADPHPSGRLSIIQVYRLEEESPHREADPWELAIDLPPLLRSECEFYVASKLEAAGRTGPTFTSRALNRLHALSEGSPRGIERIATLALMAGAVGKVEIITDALIEAVLSQFRIARLGVSSNVA